MSEAIGPNQQALENIQMLSELSACRGWKHIMLPYIQGEIANLETKILEDDSLSDQERETCRQVRRRLKQVLMHPDAAVAGARAVLAQTELKRAAQVGNS